jgi:glucokinase
MLLSETLPAQKMKVEHKPAQRLSLGIEIGGTKTQVGIGTSEHGLLPDSVIRRAVQRERGADGILKDIGSMVDEVLASRNLGLSDIEKIGIGYGGLLDTARGVTLKSYQIEGWTDLPLKGWSEGRWGKPVFVENDASTAGLAEYCLGNGHSWASGSGSGS